VSPEQWQRVCAYFEQVVEMPQTQWASWLARECPDHVLREEVLAMLEADARHAETIDVLQCVPDVLADYRQQLADGRCGQRFGAWQLERVLAEGGMGTVYLAERVAGGFVQQAALKLVRNGLDTSELVARLASERQILAGLQHPNIARLLDGGLGPGGEPFLAMEYVEGQDICRYCDTARLDIPTRLGLLLQVCDAVTYAHGRLVVHRDLKPANVLVSATGEVKLLDFGIAKLIEPGGVTAATVLQQRVYTPEYAAPEQINGDLTTTAVDVYALGVLLFELISGQRPYATHGQSVAAIEQQVLHAEPGRPSGRVTGARHGNDLVTSSGATGALESPARRAFLRATTPSHLRRQLRGDLDAIALKALRKQPHERYASVQALAEDIRAFLQLRPVAARRGSRRYALGRFVRRHALAVALSLFALVALVSGLSAALWQAALARHEAATASAALGFMQQMFALADPEVARGREVSARELLQSGSRRIRTALSDQPEARDVLLQAMAEAYIGLGLYAEALTLLEEANPRAVDAAAAQRWLLARAAALQGLGRFQQVLDEVEPARAAVSSVTAEASLYGASLDFQWGRAAQALGHFEVAEARLLAALAARERWLGLAAAETQEVSSALVSVYQLARRNAESLALAQRSLSALGPQANADPLLRAKALSSLAMVQTNSGSLDSAETLRREALLILRDIYGEDHPATTVALNNLASVLFAQRRYPEALPIFEQVLAQRRQLHASTHPSIAMAANNTANALLLTGQPARALALAKEALAIRRASLGDRHPATALSMIGAGSALLALDQLDDAQSQFEEALVLFAELYGPDNTQSISTYNNLTRIQLARPKRPEDCQYSSEAVRRVRAEPPGDSPPKLYALALHQACRLRRGEASAREPMNGLVLAYRQQVADDDPYIAVLAALPGPPPPR